MAEIQTAAQTLQWEDQRPGGRLAVKQLTHLFFFLSKKIPNLGYMNANSSEAGSKINIVWPLR